MASAFSLLSAGFGDGEAAADSEDAGGPGGAEEVFNDSGDVVVDDELFEGDGFDEEGSLVPVSVSGVLLGVGIRGTFLTSMIFLTSKTLFSAAAEAAAAFSAALVATACCSMLALWAGSSL